MRSVGRGRSFIFMIQIHEKLLDGMNDREQRSLTKGEQNMPMIIRQQDEQMVVVPAGGSILQAESEATNVLAYRHVLPIARIKTSALNVLNVTGGGKITISFLTAALLKYPDESALTGSRFADTGYSIDITTQFNGAGSAGLSFPLIDTNGKLLSIADPGALLLWKVADTGTAQVQKFVFDLHLVARES